MTYEGPLFRPELGPVFQDGHIFLGKGQRVLGKRYRDQIAEHLPPEAVDAIEVACVGRLRLNGMDEGKAELLDRVADLAARLRGALDSLSAFEVQRLLLQLDGERPGRWFNKHGEGAYFSHARRLTRQPSRGERAMERLVSALAIAADSAASGMRRNQPPVRVGRPESLDWELAAKVGAVALVYGLSPSEGSPAFVEVIEAVWEGCGIPAKPTHALRTMRRTLKASTADGAEHVLTLDWVIPFFVLTTDKRGRLRCVLRDPDDQFARNWARTRQEIQTRGGIAGTTEGE